MPESGVEVRGRETTGNALVKDRKDNPLSSGSLPRLTNSGLPRFYSVLRHSMLQNHSCRSSLGSRHAISVQNSIGRLN